MDVALVSCLQLPEPDPDAAPLAAALAAAGIDASVLAWDDPAVDWSLAPLTVLRSSWNYPENRPGFLAWAERAASLTDLQHPPPVVRWNTHKGYLARLGERGIPVCPTEVVPAGSAAPLTSILRRRGWDVAVVKPAVSAASLRTRVFGPADGDAGERHLRDLTGDGDTLVQRYLPSVEGYGERAVVWVDGVVTHAVRKERRLEGEAESVSAAAVPVTAAERALTEAAFAAAADLTGTTLMYGRADVAPDDDGEPVVMELELVEPSLFFLQSQDALDRFVGAIRDRLGR